MSDFNAGIATGFYRFDISDVETKAQQLRQIFAGIRNDAAQVSAPLGAPQTTGSPAQATQQTAATNENAAALSRQALAAGDAAGAVALMDQALGKTTQSETANTTATAASARQQAALRVALGDRIGAIELLEAALGQQVAGSAEAVAIEKQLTQVENQGLQAAQREADTTVRLAQEQARAAAATRDYAGALEILNAAKSQGGAAGAQTLAALETQIATVETAGADATVHLAQERARASVAAKDYAGALQILNVAQLEGAGASPQVTAALNTQIATTERAGTVTGALGGQLAGLISPIALIGIGFGVAAKAAQSFGDAIDLVGKLQDSRTAFGGILGDFQKGNAVLDEAAKRTRVFGITEEETTQAFRELAPVIRESTATTDQQAEALARFAVIHPEDAVNALKTAAEGLATGGRISQIAKDLDLTIGEQDRLKKAAAEGGDVFVLLNDILDRHGITLDVAAKRMDGLAGATRREQIAAEDLKKAQGNFAAGPGVALTNQQIRITNDATQAFQGSLTGLNNVVKDSVGVFNPIIGTIGAYNNAVLGAGQSALQYVGILGVTNDATTASVPPLAAQAQAIQHVALNMDDERRAAAQLQLQTGQAASDIQRSAEASTLDAAAKELQSAKTKLVTDQNRLTTDSFLALNPNMDASGAIAAAAAQGYPPLIGQLAALRIQLQGATSDQIALNNAENAKGVAKTVAVDRFAGRSGGRGDSSDAAADAAASVAATKTQTSATERQIDAQLALAAAQGNTAKQIDLLRQKGKLFGKDEVDRQQIEAQIISIEKSASKTRVSAAATTGLQLAQTEETSQLAILKAQREGLERQRDQQEDFDVKKARSQEDEDTKIRRLLATGQRGAADRERADFALQQKRDQEDFDREKRRTTRNNAESTGDIDARTDLRQSQIGDKAALRGVRPTVGGVPSNLPPPPQGVPDLPARTPPPITNPIQVHVTLQVDGKTFAEAEWPYFMPIIDTELAAALAGVPAPGGGQTAVAGSRP